MTDTKADQPSASHTYEVSPCQLSEALEACMEIGEVPFVTSPPGVGKSTIAREVADKTNRQYIDLRALLLDPIDLRGLPWRDQETDRTRYAVPEFLPPTDSKDRFLINIEELPAATPSMQAALYQLILDRKIGEYELPPGAALMACGNRREDRGVYHQPSPALSSRFVHFDLKVDAKEWVVWATDQDLAPEVVFFIHFRPDLLHVYNPNTLDKAFPCPRTWEKMSGIFDCNVSDPVRRAMFRGTIGEGAATEFSAYLPVWKSMISPLYVIENPETVEIPENISQLIALCGAITRLADDTNMEAICMFARRLKYEIGEFLVSQCAQRNPTAQTTTAWVQWVSQRH